MYYVFIGFDGCDVLVMVVVFVVLGLCVLYSVIGSGCCYVLKWLSGLVCVNDMCVSVLLCILC